MKKLTFLFIFFTFIINHSYAAGLYIESSWRWRNDNGNEKNATWMAPDTTGITIDDTTKVLRLRYKLQNVTYDCETWLGFLKCYSIIKDSTYEWGVGGTSNPFTYANSNFVAHLDTTTKQLKSKLTYNSQIDTVNYKSGLIFCPTALDLETSIYFRGTTEIEYCIKPTNKIIPGCTYYFYRSDMSHCNDMTYLSSLSNDKILTNPSVTYQIRNSIPIKESYIFKLFPNPASDNFNIQLNHPGKYDIKLISLTGKIVYTVKTNPTETNIKIPVNNLGNGVYILKISNPEASFSNLFIKQ
ncbi:MAG: T9SS type A sorting domain-containing protein [Bacteroidota bacterium]|nr:T9SS type A sorting domain-containing protein [Bacteroidota bacterium]